MRPDTRKKSTVRASSANSPCSRSARASNTPRGCPLPTPWGSMSGTYDMQREDGTAFQAEIALFQLVQPGSIH